MKQENTSLRLRRLMTEKNLRQVDILELAKPYCQKNNVKLGKSDLSQYLKGTVEPGQEKLTVLSLALDVNEAWLMGYDVPKERNSFDITKDPNYMPLPQTKKIPLLGTIACGVPILATENIDEYVTAPGSIQADFCLRCKGDSMINARILDGDIVYIKSQPDVENGEIAAVIIDSLESECTLKRVYKYPNKVVLAPENNAYEPFVYTNEELNCIRIIGKAVYFLSQAR